MESSINTGGFPVPLILPAVGALVMILVALVGFWKMRNNPPTLGSPSVPPPTVRPKLYDLWTTRLPADIVMKPGAPVAVRERQPEEGFWTNILPISVLPLYDPSKSEFLRPHDADDKNTRDPTTFVRTRYSIGPLVRHIRSRMNIAMRRNIFTRDVRDPSNGDGLVMYDAEKPKQDSSVAGNAAISHAEQRLQIAVAIAMPASSSRVPAPTVDFQGKDSDSRWEGFEYAIGLCCVPVAR